MSPDRGCRLRALVFGVSLTFHFVGPDFLWAQLAPPLKSGPDASTLDLDPIEAAPVPTKGAPEPAKPAPLTAEQQAWVEEKGKLVAQIQQQEMQNAQAALPLLQRVLARDRELFGTNHEQTVETLKLASGVYFTASQFDLATSSAGEVHQIKKALYGEQDWRTLQAHWNHEQYKHFAKIPNSLRQVDGQATATLTAAQEQFNRGELRQAMVSAKQALGQYQQVYGEDAPSCAAALELMAMISEEARELDESEKHWQAAGAIYRGWFSTQSPGFAKVLKGLGWLRYFRGQNAEAEKLLRQSLQIHENIADGSVNEYASSLARLARVLQESGQPARAVEIQRRAVVLKEQSEGRDSSSYADALLLLADLLSLTSEFKESGELIQQAEAIVSKNDATRARFAPDVLMIRAKWHQRQGQYSEALAAFQACYEINRNRLGENSAECGLLQYWIADNYSLQKKNAEAEKAYEKGVAIYLKAQGAQGADTRNTCNALLAHHVKMARELTLAGNLAEAQARLQASVQRAVEVFGEDDAVTQSARDRLAYQAQIASATPEVRTALVEAEKLRAEGEAFYAKQQYAEALDAYQRALDLSQPHLPGDNYRLAVLLRSVSYAAWGLNQWDKAEQMRRLSEPAFAKIAATGTNQLDYARTLRDLGNLCYKQGKTADAADYLVRAMEVYRGANAVAAAEAVETVENLVNCYWAMADQTRCLPVLTEYLERVRQVYGEQRLEFVQALQKSGNIYRDFSQYDPARQSLHQAHELAAKLNLGAGWDRALRFDIAIVDQVSGKIDEAMAAVEQLLTEVRQFDPGHDLLNVLTRHQQLTRAQGRWTDAEKTLVEAIELAGKLHGAGSSVVGELQNDLERVFLAQVDTARAELRFADAAPVYKRFLAQRIARFGEEHWATLEVKAYTAETQRLAQLNEAQLAPLRQARDEWQAAARHDREGRLEEALAAAQRAAEAVKKVCGEKSVTYYEALPGLTTRLQNLARYAEAEPLHRQRLALYGQLATSVSTAGALNRSNLALNLKEQERYAEALESARAAADVYVQLGYPNASSRGTLLALQGELHVMLDDHVSARRDLDEAGIILAPTQATEPTLWRDYLAKQVNLAYRLNESQRLYDFAQAKAAAVRQAGLEDSTEFAAALLDLGRAYTRLGKHDQAVEHIRRAIELWAKHADTKSYAYAVLEDFLTEAYFAQGDFAAARPLAEHAIDLFEAAGKTANARAAQVRLARVHLALGQPQKAEPLLRRIIEQKDDGKANEAIYHNATVVLQGILLGREDYAAALPLVEEALGFREQYLTENSDLLTDRTEALWRSEARAVLDRYVQLAARGAASAEEAYARVLGWKGTQYARQRRIRELRDNDQAAPLLDRWGSLSGALATLSLRTPYPEERAVWNARLASLSADKDEIEKQLWALTKSRAATAHATVEQLRGQLPADAALIDFLEVERISLGNNSQFRDTRNFVAFIVRRDVPTTLVDLGDAQPLVDLIDRWRLLTLGEKDQDPDPAAAQQVAGQLRQRLWNGLEAKLDDVKTVLVVPEGAIGKIPLAALPGSQPKTYLIDERSFVTIPAPGLLPELLARRTSPTAQDVSLLLVGNIDYGVAAGQLDQTLASADGSRSWLPYQFRDLPGFGPEVADIRSSFDKRFTGGKVLLLQRQTATEQAFRAAAAKHRWLHVATHGFFAPDVLEAAAEATPQSSVLGEVAPTDSAATTISADGLTSGLALAGANKINEEGQDDGILSAMEVATLDLSGVEMAVLSACETGLGESVGGESVVGLQRAFQVAGARTTVTSLWPVSDEATRLLMARFYRNLWSKEKPMSRLEALTEAQRWMLRAARAGAPADSKGGVLTPDHTLLPYAYQWPTFWAAFVMCGDWR